VGDAFSIFLLRQFYIRLPGELLDAARVDGADELQILGYVVIPLSKAAIATVAVLNFTFMWSDFVRPLLYLNETERYTLSIGLENYQEHHLALSATVLFMIPIFLTFWAAQRTFMSGLTLGSLKE
jgi:multiple sugar transport system permease protein